MYKVDAQVLQATLNYLAERPYKEVMNLINALQNSSKVEDNGDEVSD